MPESKEEIWGVLVRLLRDRTKGGEVLEVGSEQVVVTREQCPVMLLPANKHIPEILLVQKFTQRTKKLVSLGSVGDSCSTPVSERNGHTPSKSRTAINDLDVTGSPLKCPFMQDDGEPDFSPFTISFPSTTKRKTPSLTYVPLPSSQAGFVASRFNLALSKLPEDLEECTPLWVVCDGKDAQGLLFIGIQWGRSSCSRTLVTSKGPYQGQESLPSLDHLASHHIAVGPTKWVEKVVEATYTVLATGDEGQGSNLRLTCNWKRPLTLLTAPAPDATTTANLLVVRGDTRSPTHQLHLELSVLQGFVKGLETGEVAWFIREGPITVEQELEEVFASIREKGVHVKREEERAGGNFDMMIEGRFFNWRQNMDFTDRLWNILMRCESYQELKNSLSLVFKAVAGEEVRPQIHIRNTTQVGCLLRNLMRGKGGLPELSGLTPLHMLIEIGCEKIKRDYINAFQAGELATGEQLSWFVSTPEKVGPAQIVAQLERLHVSLQAVVILRIHLNLSLASLTHFTTQVLNQMKEEHPGTSHSFSLKLDTLSVHQQFDSMVEDTWEVSLHSHWGTNSKTLVCHVSHLPFIQFSSGGTEHEVSLEEEEDDSKYQAHYYCTFFSTVTDKPFKQ